MQKFKFIKQTLSTIFVLILGAIVNDIYPDLKNAFKNIFNKETLWDGIKAFFNLKIDAPFWLLLFLCLLVVSVLTVRIIRLIRTGSQISLVKRFFRKVTFKNDRIQYKVDFTSPLNYIPTKADQNFNISLDSKFLGSKSGIFSIWAYVSDVHNENSKGYMYIISYATKKGAFQKTPGYATYPNAWAINRIRPYENCPKGIWRFWCNNAGTEQIRIDSSEILTSGWHLFTVAWSARSNYIKFIIDKSEKGTRDFEHWPSDFSENIRVGTWPTLTPGHYFDSKIGHWRFVKAEFDIRIIEDFLGDKPE